MTIVFLNNLVNMIGEDITAVASAIVVLGFGFALLFAFLICYWLYVRKEREKETDKCGDCAHFNGEWNECEVYCMHVDSDEVREYCKDFKEKEK